MQTNHVLMWTLLRITVTQTYPMPWPAKHAGLNLIYIIQAACCANAATQTVGCAMSSAEHAMGSAKACLHKKKCRFQSLYSALPAPDACHLSSFDWPSPTVWKLRHSHDTGLSWQRRKLLQILISLTGLSWQRRKLLQISTLVECITNTNLNLLIQSSSSSFTCLHYASEVLATFTVLLALAMAACAMAMPAQPAATASAEPANIR